MRNSDVIVDFIKSWSTRDLDIILGFLAEDCFYHNIPTAPQIGVAAIRAGLSDFIAATTAVDWVILNIAEADNGHVLTERIDRFWLGDKLIEMQVMGIFELANGKISVWRDYYDENQFTRQMTS